MPRDPSTTADQVSVTERAARATYSQAEAAIALGWGLPRLRGAVHHGRIAAVHLSGAVRIPRAEVERVREEGL